MNSLPLLEKQSAARGYPEFPVVDAQPVLDIEVLFRFDPLFEFTYTGFFLFFQANSYRKRNRGKSSLQARSVLRYLLILERDSAVNCAHCETKYLVIRSTATASGIV